ncbi:MAG: MOSC domain-containing protein [Gemmatimonadales bacterium]
MSVKPKTPGERGLPKRSVPVARITPVGVEGDYNHYRTDKTGGDPNLAVLVITDEVLAGLRAEGWPVEAGDLGENLTLGGIPESALGPGARLELGEALVEITSACDPCTELYVLPYVGSERGPAFIRALTGRRGWYAKVLGSGMVESGARVTLVASPAVPLKDG